LVLSIFYTYNFIGTRFIYALIVGVVMVLAYALIFGLLRDFPVPVLMSHVFFIVSANLIGGGAGYLAEYQRRELFVRETELDLERKHHLDRSLHDRLTGLPNRELLEDRIAQLLARGRRDSGSHLGLYIDLDGFKAINDTLGHDRGDAVLCDAARRLVAAVRVTDTVSRLGGDEFFVLAHDVDSREGAVQLAEKLLECIEQPLAGLPVASSLSASIGICIFHGGVSGNDDPLEIIRQADRAMYQAKAGGKNRYAFAEI
jgi:diguanylate cyclase (GGDEF)-like protein